MEKASIDDRKKYINLLNEQIRETRFIINDSVSDINDITTSCRGEHIRNNFDAIFIDYLQLIDCPGFKPDNDFGRVTFASGALRKLAKSLNTRVVLLSQLNRGLEMRDNKRPMMSDLRSSGQIEQDAVLILFLYRPNYYGIKEYDEQTNKLLISQTEIIVGKNRFGGTGRAVRLHFGTGITNESEIINNGESFQFRNTREVKKIDGKSKIPKKNTIDTKKLWG
jgi:replicative DNA helicase